MTTDPTYPGPTPASRQEQVAQALEEPRAYPTPEVPTTYPIRDLGTSIMLGWFDGSHLTDASLAVWSARCLALAEHINEELMVSAERSAALRHLLEAKDCLIRAQILTNKALNR